MAQDEDASDDSSNGDGGATADQSPATAAQDSSDDATQVQKQRPVGRRNSKKAPSAEVDASELEGDAEVFLYSQLKYTLVFLLK